MSMYRPTSFITEAFDEAKIKYCVRCEEDGGKEWVEALFPVDGGPIVAERLRKVFPRVKIRNYYTNAALLLGVESRTSSPVRIPRDPETLQYVSMPGVYPCGEGAGYSGGIVSSAIDGIRCAEAVSKVSN